MILPASLGYGSAAQGPIPANSTLVFVVDLKSVSG
jgi:FKBP-type peptidyl-prolyl cis-trans isomerase